jgi:serine/threonine-protein kinase
MSVDVASGARRIVASSDIQRPANFVTGNLAVWGHDGRRFIYQVGPEAPGGAGLMWKPLDGSSPAERLTSSRVWQQPQMVTADGRFLVYQEAGGVGTSDATVADNYDLWLLPLMPRREPRPLLRTKANERLPYVSPDSRWMAYVSDETGRDQVWVRSFPDGPVAIQVSQESGTEPVWAPDGKTLYYRDASGMRLNAVAITVGAVPQFGPPAVTIGHWIRGVAFGRTYDITPDGSALLMNIPPTYGRELGLVLNFDEVIRRKMAAALK